MLDTYPRNNMVNLARNDGVFNKPDFNASYKSFFKSLFNQPPK
ncbi:MAG: hypothetical protein JWQ54_5293 [Mucilaginibacter sp.]|nr:hypothetical protein [Mucilaginibacter sp.]